MIQSILVIGSTGKQGSAVVRELLSEGWKVRAFTRNKHNQKLANIKDDNLEIFEGDLSNQSDLKQAMNEQYGVYCVQPIIQNDVEQELQQGKAIIDTAVKQDISYVVYSTAGGVNRNRTGPHFEALAKIEDMLRESPLNYTIIKPSFFMDNFLRIAKVEADNIYIPEFISPDIKFAMIPSDDIAKITAQIFKNVDEYNHQSIEIASDELTLNEVVDTFTSVTNKKTEIKGQFSSQIAEKSWLEEKGYVVDFEQMDHINPNRLRLNKWISKNFK